MLITSDTELRKYIPNVVKTVDGEPSLFDKLQPFLESAERWVSSTFTGQAVYDAVCDRKDDDALRKCIATIVVTHTMFHVIPSLDVILTPNGFGIVSNANVAPASKERVERLVASMENIRDNNVAALLLALPADDGVKESWLGANQAAFFAATLFPNLALCDKVGSTEHRWKQYLALRQQLIAIETDLAEQYFSQEQMAVFRHEALTGFSGTRYAVQIVVQSIRSLEVEMLLGRCPHPQAFRDIVNYIRQHLADFPEWHASDTAKLFSPEIFENKKSSKGFWF